MPTCTSKAASKPGKQHEVLLKVYGPQRVDLEIDGLPGWIDGGDVEIPE